MIVAELKVCTSLIEETFHTEIIYSKRDVDSVTITKSIANYINLYFKYSC